VVADRAGWLAGSPPAGPHPAAEPGVALSYWPVRSAGDRIALTHTNRDYLGLISAIGPDQAGVERSVAALRHGGRWPVSPEPPMGPGTPSGPERPARREPPVGSEPPAGPEPPPGAGPPAGPGLPAGAEPRA
jgi:hypothetical protein